LYPTTKPSPPTAIATPPHQSGTCGAGSGKPSGSNIGTIGVDFDTLPLGELLVADVVGVGVGVVDKLALLDG